MKSYTNIGADCAVVLERDGDSYDGDVKFKATSPDRSHGFSRVLATDEIGQLSASLALIYFKRTNRMPLFQGSIKTPMVVATFDVEPKCEHCDGTCTGDCL